MPNRKIRIHSQCLTSKKSTGFESQHTRFTRTARTAYRRNAKVARLKRGKTVRWTQTTQLSRPMAGPVLPYLPTALQLNRATVALSLAGRLSRRDGGGWGVGGCWSWHVPRCARLLLSPPLFPAPAPPRPTVKALHVEGWDPPVSAGLPLRLPARSVQNA